MGRKLIFRIASLVMVFCFLFTMSPLNTAFAEETTVKSLDEQREELAKNLENAEKKLNSLGKESKDTKEYLDALDERIAILNEKYLLAKAEVKDIEKKVEELKTEIEQSEKDISEFKDEIENLQGEYAVLNEDFEDTYNAYCSRIRAIYISGDQSNMLSFILESNSLASMLTRYQMISAVSKQDGELLQSVKTKVDSILAAKTSLDEKNKALTFANRKMTTSKASLESRRIELLEKQEDMESQQADIEEKQGEANRLLKSLNDKTKEYGEYRDITQAELDEIDDAIAEADRKYRESATTTATTKKSTTKKPAPDSQGSGGNDKETTTSITTAEQADSPYIRLTYPCPSYKAITCAFGAYSGHTGCDFSTRGNENQNIVAAESGIVIISADLTNSDGSYRSYGRYIVIRHDKTTSSGKTVYTLYAHNNSRLVSEGQYVTKGQKIALSGSTGNSTGPHCHFEVRVGGASQSNAVNPAIYLP